jgi:hypothetical protein
MFTDNQKILVNRIDAEAACRPMGYLRSAGLAALLIGLAGCAGAPGSNVAAVQPSGPSPSEILVAADAAPMTDATQTHAAQQIASKLQIALVERLTGSRVTAEPFVPGTSHPRAAVLHVSVVQANPGSLVERFVVGFGLGSAKLQANAELESADGSGGTSLTAFNTSSDSGMKPGLILPGAVALATWNPIHLAIGGGIDIAMNLRGGLARPTSSTASAIVAQLKKYDASAGWYWEAGNET